MERKTVIVGIGQTRFSSNSGRSEWQLALEAVQAALVDARLEPTDVDGLVRYSCDAVDPAMMARSLGMRDIRWYSDVPFGGTAQCAVLAQASAAIQAGIARTVLVWRALNERSGRRYGRAEETFLKIGNDTFAAAGIATPGGQFSGPYGLAVSAQVVALWAQRYAYETGLDRDMFADVLGRIAVTQRAYANSNPDAMMKDKPLDMESYLSGPMLSDPLRLYDYCLESDGAIAIVLTSAKTARSLRDDVVHVLAAHQGLYPHSESMTVYARDVLQRAGPGNVSKLYADAGVRPSDIDFAQLYDATSYQVLSEYETYGFAKRGQGWRAIREHGIGLDSPLPVNTHGGHLSEAYIHGLNHITEAVRQLRGTAANQVPGAELGLVGCIGMSAALLGR